MTTTTTPGPESLLELWQARALELAGAGLDEQAEVYLWCVHELEEIMRDREATDRPVADQPPGADGQIDPAVDRLYVKIGELLFRRLQSEPLSSLWRFMRGAEK